MGKPLVILIILHQYFKGLAHISEKLVDRGYKCYTVPEVN